MREQKKRKASCDACVHCMGGWNDIYCEISGAPILEDELKEQNDCSRHEFGL